jgi:transposase-like protein
MLGIDQELAGLPRMEAMAKHRTYSIEFKRQVAQEYIAGETLHALAKRHDLSRNLSASGWRSTKLAPSRTTSAQAISCTNTKRRSPLWNAWWGGKRLRSNS